jgi:hypothetical protein
LTCQESKGIHASAVSHALTSNAADALSLAGTDGSSLKKEKL